MGGWDPGGGKTRQEKEGKRGCEGARVIECWLKEERLDGLRQRMGPEAGGMKGD